MNVSLIAIISLGSPAYVYDPYPVHVLYPEPAYEAYDPYYDAPNYEEPYYADPYYEPVSYRSGRNDLGDVLLTFLGIALIGKVLDADVDFVVGYPYYPRYRPHWYPVVYRPYYDYDPWYRPAYCYDPWWPRPVYVSDPWYHCEPDRYVVNNYYSGWSQPNYSYPDFDRSYSAPYLASAYDSGQKFWSPVRGSEKGWSDTRSVASLNSGLPSSIPAGSLASTRSWKQDKGVFISRSAGSSTNFPKGRDRAFTSTSGFTASHHTFSSRPSTTALQGPKGRNARAKGNALEMRSSYSQKALKERDWGKKVAAKGSQKNSWSGHGRGQQSFAVRSPQRLSSWNRSERQSFQRKFESQNGSTMRGRDYSIGRRPFERQLQPQYSQRSQTQSWGGGFERRKQFQPRQQPFGGRNGGFERKQFQPRQEVRSWGGGTDFRRQPQFQSRQPQNFRGRGGGSQQRPQFQPRQQQSFGSGPSRQYRPQQGGSRGGGDRGRGRGH